MKTFFTLYSPHKLNSFIMQWCKCMCYLWKPFNESLIIPNQSHKGSNFRYTFWCRPSHNIFNLFWIRCYSFFINDMPQVLNLPMIKRTFTHMLIYALILFINVVKFYWVKNCGCTHNNKNKKEGIYITKKSLISRRDLWHLLLEWHE